MKLFWKMFFSITVTTVAVFCFGGHLLIQGFFKRNMDEAVEQAERTNYSMERLFVEASKIYFEGETWTFEEDGSLNGDDVYDIAGRMQVSQLDDVLGIRIVDKKGKTLFCSEELQDEYEFLSGVDIQKNGYQISYHNQRYLLRFVRCVNMRNVLLYFESVSDITDVFEEKDEQYQSYGWILVLLIFIVAGLALLLSIWITTPIKRLSQATKEVAGGNYKMRLLEKGNGEFAQLSKDFNDMTATLEQNIYELEEEGRRREEFVGSFSHEMKTPLTSIIGYADMIRSRELNPEENILYANHIYRQGKRLEALSRKMLQLSVAREGTLEVRNIHLADLFAEILEEMRSLLEVRNIQTVCEVDDVCIEGDCGLTENSVC